MAKEKITTRIFTTVAGKLKEMQAEAGGADLKPAIVKKKLHDALEAKIKSKLAGIAEHIEGLTGDAGAKEAAIKKAVAPRLKAKIGEAVDGLAGEDLTDAVKTKLKEMREEKLEGTVGRALKKIVASGLEGDELKAKLKEELPEKLKKAIARHLRGAEKDDLLLLQGPKEEKMKAKILEKVSGVVGDLADASAKEKIAARIATSVAGKLKEMREEAGGADLKPAIVKKKLHEALEAKIKSKLAGIAEHIEGLTGD